MLFYIFLAIGVWDAGVIANGDLCDGSLYQVCQYPDWDFPKSEAEMDQMCRGIIDHFDCVQNYSDKCGYGDDLQEENYRKLRSLLADGCRKDSPLHLGIVQNIGCLNEVIEFDRFACMTYLTPKVKAMSEYIRNIEVGEEYGSLTRKEEIWTSFSCLRDALQGACLASKTYERCGPESQDVAIEILTRTVTCDGTYSAANEEITEELLSLLDIGSEEKAALKRFLPKL